MATYQCSIQKKKKKNLNICEVNKRTKSINNVYLSMVECYAKILLSNESMKVYFRLTVVSA